MVFPVVIYLYESWRIEKAECWRTDTFELWCWRRLFRVPWRPRRSNQSILKEINPEYSLERLTLKLKLQYLGHLMQSADSLEKTLMLGKIEGEEKRWWRKDEMVGRHHRLNGHEFEQTQGDSEEQGSLVCCSLRGHKESDTTEWLTLSLKHGFSSTHVRMWELDHKEGWVLKNWCFWIVVLEKTLQESLGQQ